MNQNVQYVAFRIINGLNNLTLSIFTWDGVKWA